MAARSRFNKSLAFGIVTPLFLSLPPTTSVSPSQTDGTIDIYSWPVAKCFWKIRNSLRSPPPPLLVCSRQRQYALASNRSNRPPELFGRIKIVGNIICIMDNCWWIKYSDRRSSCIFYLIFDNTLCIEELLFSIVFLPLWSTFKLHFLFNTR